MARCVLSMSVVLCEFGSQGCVFRHFGQFYSFKERLHIKTGAAYHYWHLSASLDAGHGCAAVAQILEQIVFRSGIGYVDKMIRHVCSVVGKVLSCADVHSTVYLPGVGAYYLAAGKACERHSLAGFSAGRGAYYHGYGACRAVHPCAFFLRLNMFVILSKNWRVRKKRRSSL